MVGLPDRLATRTLELVDIPSESGDEERIREHLRRLVPERLPLVFAGDEVFLFCPERRAQASLVLLAGHYDTVPAQGNLPGRIDNGAVHGLGASDMKGGLAVAIELVRDLATTDAGPFDVGLLLFGREELPVEHDPLPALFAASPLVHETELAILLEPTAGAIHAGCLGNVIARATFHGTSGHSARPWLVDSAITKAVAALARVQAVPERVADVGGLRFVETVSATRLEAGIADNVIPGEATATLNFRYPPDRTPDEAEDHLRSLLPDEVTLDVVGNAPPADPATEAPLVEALRASAGLVVEPKLAWTNVADFAAHGIPAINLGPGRPELAHARDERVEVALLVAVYETLRRFVAPVIGDDAI